MTDSELNLAIHQEVEGWQEAEWCDFRSLRRDAVPDYCNDAVWCLRMMEKHDIAAFPTGIATAKWSVNKYDETLKRPVQVYDSRLTRAVALVVLQLTREGK